MRERPNKGPRPALSLERIVAAAVEEGWRDGLSRWAWTELAALRRNPWVLRIPISGPPVTPNAIAWLEVGLVCLRDTGLEEHEKLSVILLLTASSGTRRRWRPTSPPQAAGAAPPDPELMPSYGGLLARLTDPERFPALHAVIAAGVFDEPDEDNYDFVFGLERVLDGFETLIEQRRSGRG